MSKLISNIVILLSKVSIQMEIQRKGIPYPENIYLKGKIAVSGRTVTELAKTLRISRQTLNRTVNGFYKGNNVVPRLVSELENPTVDFNNLSK